MEKLKPIRKFEKDVKSRDLVRIVFGNNLELAGYLADIFQDKDETSVTLNCRPESRGPHCFDASFSYSNRDHPGYIRGYEILKRSLEGSK